MKTSIDMAGIRDRADVYLHARAAQGPYNCPVTASESADDVPLLLSEIELMKAELERLRAIEASPIGEFGSGYFEIGDTAPSPARCIASKHIPTTGAACSVCGAPGMQHEDDHPGGEGNA